MIELLVLIATGVLLVVAASIIPVSSSLSSFERKRRKDEGSKDVKLNQLRSDANTDITSLQRAVVGLLLVLFVLQAVGVFGWIVGVVVAVLMALEYSALARLPALHSTAQRLYERYEQSILETIQKYSKWLWWIRTVAPETKDPKAQSKAELEHMLQQVSDIVNKDQQQLLLHSLAFEDKVVKNIMTPRSMIDSIKKTEILGPLVLDDLHKTGHSRFPVVEKDIDHVVGMLYLRDVLTIDTKRKHTATAETAMDKHVYYIHEDQSLTHALSAFLKMHHHLFVVVNEFRETVGLLSLEDTIEALIGREIIDEFDTHDDLRQVAARKPRSNPSTAATTDV